MTEDPAPVSFCDLSHEALRERIALIRREVLPHALASEALPEGRAWRFAKRPALRKTLEDLVALERECCRDGVRFELCDAGDQLRLEVTGVDPDAPVFRALETGGEGGADSRETRLAKAGGLGLGLSLALFCALPMGLALWLGAAAAAPFAGLDHPLVVVLGAAIFAVTYWQLVKRRAVRARRAREVASS